MSEWLKDLLIAFGGGATATISVILIFKSIFSRIIEKAVDTTFDKSTLRLTNRLERSTKAYNILLEKEFACYEKLDENIAILVPLIQDLEIISTNETLSSFDKQKFNECFLKYLEIIPKVKNIIVLYQPYVTEEVFGSVTTLVNKMQSDIHYICMALNESNEKDIDKKRMEDYRDNVLMAISLVETQIKNRLIDLTRQ